MKRLTVCVVVIMLITSAATLPFVLNAGFGQAPQGAQLSQVEQSANYRDGQFHNQDTDAGLYRKQKYARGVVGVSGREA